MILPGHLAAGQLAATCTHSNRTAALLAAVFPDVVDKSARYVLQLSPSGRVPAHSIFVAFATFLALRLFCRRAEVRRGWMAGYLVHLGTDVASDLLNNSDRFAYLTWPLAKAQPGRYRTLLSSITEYTPGAWMLEAGAVLVALLDLRRRRQGGQ
jgi:hypothetical protein